MGGRRHARRGAGHADRRLRQPRHAATPRRRPLLPGRLGKQLRPEGDAACGVPDGGRRLGLRAVHVSHGQLLRQDRGAAGRQGAGAALRPSPLQPLRPPAALPGRAAAPGAGPGDARPAHAAARHAAAGRDHRHATPLPSAVQGVAAPAAARDGRAETVHAAPGRPPTDDGGREESALRHRLPSVRCAGGGRGYEGRGRDEC